MAHDTNSRGLIAKKGIELLTFGTPNGFKVAILLEELREAYGMDYTFQNVNIFENIQKEPWFVSLNPNAKIPLIVDHDKGGYAVMESSAIINYLVRHYDTGYKFHFEDSLEACTAEQWLLWQTSGIGPAQAQANFFYRFHHTRQPFPIQRFVGETERCYGILNARLSTRDYIAGPGRGQYSIADIALWPFVESAGVTGIEISKFPNVFQWWERIATRPAIKRGMCVPSGKPFMYGYEAMKKKREEDPEGFEAAEEPLRSALEDARMEFGYVYKSP
ncbi:glutathione S-transferase [Polyplosphaeria fusca]|uniref:Glutathione S-transferase n=1 Tax=Polyplosphaeria fusca TaxID=682080 RepID=A0A9P4R2L7_9PLEO|nr:glutathione S-transferase [Polyplosphaeria fusca]